ncbi:MAG: NUDIX hydrolase [Candidatus Sungbacteria bacterium]|nr:NUDIX hydrolase [Candidatus Sungbacteria bacterium]
MKILNKETVYKGKFLHLIKTHFLDKNGTPQVWESVERPNSKMIVIIFTLTKEREVVLVRQFRIAQNTFVLESPAGLCDKEGESYEDVARRELLEETGYRASEFIKINEGPYNSGTSKDRAIVFFAKDAEKVQGQNLDDSEEIEVVKVPLSEIVGFLANLPEGTVADIKILGSLPILQARGLI